MLGSGVVLGVGSTVGAGIGLGVGEIVGVGSGFGQGSGSGPGPDDSRIGQVGNRLEPERLHFLAQAAHCLLNADRVGGATAHLGPLAHLLLDTFTFGGQERDNKIPSTDG